MAISGVEKGEKHVDFGGHCYCQSAKDDIHSPRANSLLVVTQSGARERWAWSSSTAVGIRHGILGRSLGAGSGDPGVR